MPKVGPAPGEKGGAEAASRKRILHEWDLDELDLNHDGHVDGEDVLLAVSIGTRMLSTMLFLIFDVTYWVLPIGAIVGLSCSVIGMALVESAVVQAKDAIAFTVSDLRSQGLLPVDDVLSMLGLDANQMLGWATAALILLIVTAGVTLVNGVYVGVQRVSRRHSPPPGCECCVKCCCPDKLPASFHCFQGTFAVVGTALYLASIATMYAASAIVLVLLVLLTFFKLHCDHVAPLVDRGLTFSAETLASANETYALVYGQYVSTIEPAAQELFPPWATPQQMQLGILFLMSPAPALMATVGQYFGLAETSIHQASAVLATATDFDAFMDTYCKVAAPLPDSFSLLYAGTVLALIGQIVLYKYHMQYYTIFYYEAALRRQRAQQRRANRLSEGSARNPVA